MIKIYVSDKDFEEIAERNHLSKDLDTLHFGKYGICFKRNKYVRIKLPGDFIVNAEYEEMEKSKMTREEAVKAIRNTHEAHLFVARLHALGLLKFEEPKSLQIAYLEDNVSRLVGLYTASKITLEELTERLKSLITTA